MNDRKYELNRFSIYDSTAVQRHLEEMAAKGWMIRKLGMCLCQYERIEPRQLHFAVVCLPKVSPYDPVPTPGQQLLEEYATADGWKLEAQQDAMLLFSNDRPDPVPMETDPAVQAEGLVRLARKRVLSGNLATILLAVLQLVMQLSALRRRPAEYLADPAESGLLLLWVIILLEGALTLIRTLRWIRRAKAAAAQGQLPPSESSRATLLSTVFNLSVLAAAVLLLGLAMGKVGLASIVVMLGVAWLISLGNRGLREAGVSRGVNIVLTATAALVFTITVTVVLAAVVISHHQDSGGETFTTSSGWTFSVYHDEMPLYVQELEDVPDISWSTQAEEHRTPLLSRTEYTQRALSNDNSLPDLSYTVTRVKVPALYAPLKTWMIQSKKDDVHNGKVVFPNHYVSADAAPWGAQDAYQLYWSGGLLDTYLLFYENTAVEITMPSSPTPEQMAMVGEKLGG